MKSVYRKDIFFAIKFFTFLLVAPIVFYLIFWRINIPAGITYLNDRGATLHAGDTWEEGELFRISLEKPVQIPWDSEAFYQYVYDPERQFELEKENGYAVYLIPFKCDNLNYPGYYDVYVLGKKPYIKGLQCTFPNWGSADISFVTKDKFGKFPAVPVPISESVEDEYIVMIAKPNQTVDLRIRVEKEAKKRILAPEKFSRKVYEKFYQFVLE